MEPAKVCVFLNKMSPIWKTWSKYLQCILVLHCCMSAQIGVSHLNSLEEEKAKVVWEKACMTWEYEICQLRESSAQCLRGAAAHYCMLPNYHCQCSSEYMIIVRHSNSGWWLMVLSKWLKSSSSHSFNSWGLPKGVSHLFLHCHILCTIMSHGACVYSDMPQAVVSTGM